MRDKKGFTLVELLAVIILIVVITILGSYGIRGAQKQIKNDMWQSQMALILNRAKSFGEDNKLVLESNHCEHLSNKEKCLEITVQTLIDRKYLTTKEKDGCEQKVLVNNTFKEDKISCLNENKCYFVNSWPIYVYMENNMVYAQLVTPADCKEE